MTSFEAGGLPPATTALDLRAGAAMWPAARSRQRRWRNTLPPPCSRAPLRGPPARQVGLDAIASWQVVCNITRLKAKASRCCVFFSAFYNDSVVPCGCPDGLSCDTDAAPLLLPPEPWAKIKCTAFDNRTAKAKAWVQRGLQHPALLAVDQEPESQANATVFLAKFYGRAGLINLINAGPNHLRPVPTVRDYESCFGSVGLLWSQNWQLCQAAVDAVLKGDRILQISSEAAANHPLRPLHKAMVSSYDIRHITKDDPASSAAAHLP
ncbi:hypothetical protein Taro_014874 [Colocasia esculenta]|uniref:COBRA C-terminal domain-containing protein n=1 Tax=Colocasia esculenta TaxID=4460 RepID=A0A843URH1_COLES|nr:hypothetical protein [Colocasia esculenta]